MQDVSQDQAPKRWRGGDWNPRPNQVWRAVGREVCFLVPSSTSTRVGRRVRNDNIASFVNSHHLVGDIIVIAIQRELTSQDREPEFIPP